MFNIIYIFFKGKFKTESNQTQRQYLANPTRERRREEREKNPGRNHITTEGRSSNSGKFLNKKIISVFNYFSSFHYLEFEQTR